MVETDSETGELKLVSRFCASVDTELEAVFRDITPVDFQNLIQFFRSNPDYDVKPNPDRLDVVLHDKTRVTITDPESIRTFVTQNQARYASVMRKTPVANADFPDAGFRLNLKRERVYGAHEKCPADILKPSSRVPPIERVYRLIKRFSCLSLDGLCRFDISAVKYASSSLPRFRDVPDKAFRESFEVEVECINRREAPQVILDALLHNIAIINAIVAPVVDRRVVEEMQRLSGVRGFLGPNLVTLDKVNLLPPDVDIISVRNGDYVVTEKADGERTLLFVDAKGVVYAINNLLRFATVGRAASVRSSILDCERVLGKKFMVFDIYFFESRSVADLPLIKNPDVASAEDRVTYIARVVNDVEMLDGFEIVQKKYYEESEACTVLSDFRLGRLGDYEIDGLVYMPRSMPVGAMFVGDKARLASVRWDHAFKWKPPAQNTVDFQVVFADVEAAAAQTSSGTTDDNIRKVARKGRAAAAPKAKLDGLVYLYVGHKPWSDAIRPLDFLTGRPRPVNEYGRKLFEPAPTARLAYDSLKKAFVCADGSPIKDGGVVEFSFDREAAGGGQWKAERLRPDKDDKGGNNYDTAFRVWGTINDPLLEEHVCGKKQVFETKESLLEDRYSLRSLDRNQLGSRNMARYHGWLKERLIAMAFELAGRSKGPGEERRIKVLDLACGKGGDMDKMRRHGVGAVVGIDSAKDSIVNGADGTYARMYKDPREYKSFVFGYYDLSKPLTVEGFNAYFSSDSQQDNDMHQILLAVWGAPSSVDLGASRNGLAADKFDVVTCMFALHYFFKTDESLDTFLDNVSDNLRVGGIFAGCCFDGASVEAALAEQARRASRDDDEEKQPRLVGRLDNGRLVWLVEATPTTFSRSSGRPNNGTGREIRVYVDSINHKISEYLVDFDFLQERALAKGLKLLEHVASDDGSTGTTLPATSGLFQEAMRGYDATSGLSAAEKRYSSFNRWFTFQKTAVVQPVTK